MDSITQAVFGAAIQGAMLGRSQGRKALVYGAFLGTLPDLDVMIRYADPVSAMTHHRGFSHSLIVISVCSLLFAWLIRRWRPAPDYTAGRLALTIWLVLTTHVLLDALTSYGTQIWWPFTPTPVSWSSIFIVDPVFTTPLVLAVLAGLAIGIGRRMHAVIKGVLVFCFAYLAFTVGAKILVEHSAAKALANDDVEITEVFSAPAPLNTLLWRVILKDDQDHYYEGFISLFDRGAPDFVRLPLNTALAAPLVDTPYYGRLRWFTGNWLRQDVIGDTLVVTDLRMGMSGHHFFRFAMARETDGRWNMLVPMDWPGRRGGMPELRMLWQRIWDEGARLPLGRWDRYMTESPW
ncbi:metal-dependent hydrolase [Verticiella sediminum]|uniref:Metal-dependent hydrolase n=1 Tax=Verticiella sediminum TaxID=1247510 RepID=A0A556AVD5_9BURK|nr:metal-dependent hydrolase [Verticiella sediminum]TSH96912.1 metal-dependent hydrolase [Verticiella sediminum]